MKNKFLSPRTAQEIDDRVAKILKELGNPEPPLRLEEVRDLLSLDLAYYSSTDNGILKEVVHRLMVAGKQVVLRPSLLIDVVTKFDLRALFLPDRTRVLIDSTQPPIKHRWYIGHEIIHSIVPWHSSLMLGDTRHTLTPSCHDQIEAESNYGAGSLLFLLDEFADRARDTRATINSIKGLNNIFGNTITNTLWHYIEQSHEILFGLVTVHPHILPLDFNPKDPCKYFIRSKPFELQFPGVTEVELFKIIARYCTRSRGGPLGEDEAVLHDLNGTDHIFRFETFYNRYEALTLGVHEKMKHLAISA